MYNNHIMHISKFNLMSFIMLINWFMCFKMHNELFAINISKQCKNYSRKFEIFVGVFIRILP